MNVNAFNNQISYLDTIYREIIGEKIKHLCDSGSNQIFTVTA